jgi:hypothetical protein
MTSRLQVAEAIATGGDVRAAKRAYYADPRCSCCEDAPVVRKIGRNRETGERYTLLPDICDECFGDAARTFGDWRRVKELTYNSRFQRS